MTLIEQNRIGRLESVAMRRAESAVREYRLGLLGDHCTSLTYLDSEGNEHALKICLVGYVHLDVVILCAPGHLLTEDSREVVWGRALQAIGRTDVERLVLVEHTNDAPRSSTHFTGPVSVLPLQEAGVLPAMATLQARSH